MSEDGPPRAPTRRRGSINVVEDEEVRLAQEGKANLPVQPTRRRGSADVIQDEKMRVALEAQQKAHVRAGKLLKGGGFMHKDFTVRNFTLGHEGRLMYKNIGSTFRGPDGKEDESKASIKPGGAGKLRKVRAKGELGFNVTVERTDSEQNHKVGEIVTWKLKAEDRATASLWLEDLKKALPSR